MVKCAIEGCNNYQGNRQKDTHIKFLCFPKDHILNKKWRVACGRRLNTNFQTARICSEHFTESDWKLQHILLNVPVNKRRLRAGAVPTQNLPYKAETSSNDQESKGHEEFVKKELTDYNEAEDVEISFSDDDIDPQSTENAEYRTTQPPTTTSGRCNLRQENTNLREESHRLLIQLRKLQASVRNFEKIFSKGQIKRLKKQNITNWSFEDISSSVSLYTASPLMYQMMLQKKYPFPSMSTIRKWLASFKLRPGIIANTINTLAASTYEVQDRLCVLAFIEIRLKPRPADEEDTETGLRPYKYAQVFMVRGLLGDWKHIIYYNFDCMMPGLVLKDLIRKLNDINFTVVAGVTGVGPRKLALWRELQINEEKPSLEVIEGNKVFFFANVPHLIKRLRNHFLATGFELNGVTINAKPLNEMLSVQPSEVQVNHGLSQSHIDFNRVSRHNLKMDLKLFSTSVAEAIRKCVVIGKLTSANATDCSDFIQLVEEWFRVFNSKLMPEAGGKGTLTYGLVTLEKQNTIIASMNDLIRNMQVNENEESFQLLRKGILLNNRSLPMFHKYLNYKHDVAYVITNNLNSDDIEHSFGLRKSVGGIAQRPTPLEFKYRIRAAVVIHMSEHRVMWKNV